jgi:predicted membrane-bound spermidine synthase
MDIIINIPDGKSGNWSVETFTVTEDEIKIFNIRAMFKPGCRIMKAGTYKRLMRNSHVVMSNTPAEIRDHSYFIDRAQNLGGHILINGLGLGVALTEILKSDKVEKVTVIEISQDVINLVAPTFKNDPRVEIIHADAFEWKPPKGIKYTCVWNDIWDDICGDNLPEMTKLHRKYGKRTVWQDSWCKHLCKREIEG